MYFYIFMQNRLKLMRVTDFTHTKTSEPLMDT